MANTKPSNMAKSKPSSSKPSSKPGSKPGSKPSGLGEKKRTGKPRKAKEEVKTSREKQGPKKKRRTYTEKELGIPTLNMITPAGVQKPSGKKKGKVFVDDPDSLQTILAMVNAEKEGQIESKMTKARHMEEIREARRKEAEARHESKRSKLEETKGELKRQKKRPSESDSVKPEGEDSQARGKAKKRVSFG
ncbi:hypothetical protein P152DRAFT_456712 [Eremomyces bilateralis CBS 781.70]|uniref:60S ribosomal subunit assembly/export protein LOC1 n=1 Tax=Eremomyces bilateralis CBS 781.70 TaxID=1392243 RepID=A0A6G1G8Q6_9PEZI|nr:uncharacterized protein P152DRAFT_456712 [Eremomyces bilateralis CBS 781.70]KAF1814458.1 hypothetical protein P152DRAFT_456712 [Eremomyces bilateralis CBS 781.70]